MSGNYFSKNYAEGREKFFSFCEKAQTTVDSYINPCGKGPNGEVLATDVAWFGDPGAPNVLLTMCGTHGLEGSSGSATFLQWIDNEEYLRLPEKVAVIMVHGVNPYGWAYDSRTNEDNIDINRNCIDHGSGGSSNPAYRELHDATISGKEGDIDPQLGLQHFRAFAEKYGIDKAINGIVSGQYDTPDGLFYGGKERSWSFQTIQKIVKDKLRYAKKVAVVDWHTGIGSYSELFLISHESEKNDKYRMSCDWWGEERMHSDDLFDSAGSTMMTGLIVPAIQREVLANSGADLVGITAECGTFPPEAMIEALFMDRWLRFVEDDERRNSPEAIAMRTRLVERFYPSMPEWRGSILINSRGIFEQAINGLSKW